MSPLGVVDGVTIFSRQNFKPLTVKTIHLAWVCRVAYSLNNVWQNIGAVSRPQLPVEMRDHFLKILLGDRHSQLTIEIHDRRVYQALFLDASEVVANRAHFLLEHHIEVEISSTVLPQRENPQHIRNVLNDVFWIVNSAAFQPLFKWRVLRILGNVQVVEENILVGQNCVD